MFNSVYDVVEKLSEIEVAQNCIDRDKVDNGISRHLYDLLEEYKDVLLSMKVSGR